MVTTDRKIVGVIK